MDLIIIRHGQSEADILNVNEGRADFALTDLGQRQAKLMAKWVDSYIELDKIFCSTLKRARQTGEKLSTATGVPIEFSEELMEWNNGLIAGLSREEANAKYPPPEKIYPHTSNYEQESNIEFRARAETVFSRIINENPIDYKIAIVAHSGLINKLFHSFLMLPVSNEIGLKTGDTGIHHWQINNSEENKNRGWASRQVIFSNSLIHLDNLVI